MVSLQTVDKDNWLACVALKVAEAQKDFLPSNLSSIAGAQFYPQSRSRAIYVEDVLVGYALYGIDEATGLWKIFRLMIDEKFQGNGYGRAAMKVILEDIRREKAEVVLVRYNLENEVAGRLYESLGFKEIGRNETHATAQCLLN
jgi:diamine N-acetyltransferase